MNKFLSVVLLALLAGCRGEPVEVPVEFPARSFDGRQAAQALAKDRTRLGDWQPGETGLRFVENLKTFNRRAAAGENVDSMLTELLSQTKEFLRQEGAENLHKLSLWLTERFELSLKRLKEECGPDDARALCAGKAVGAELAQLADENVTWSSDLVLHACRAGLLYAGAGGLEMTEEGAFLLRVAFKVRLAGLWPESEKAMDTLLDPFEKKSYYFWVAERSPVASLERKLEAVRQLRQLDAAYPDVQARGILHYQAGRFDVAAADFELVLRSSPDDAKIRSWLEQAKKKLAAAK